jgi:hypothetical protein
VSAWSTQDLLPDRLSTVRGVISRKIDKRVPAASPPNYSWSSRRKPGSNFLPRHKVGASTPEGSRRCYANWAPACAGRRLGSSFPRKRESKLLSQTSKWVPAFAGTTMFIVMRLRYSSAAQLVRRSPRLASWLACTHKPRTVKHRYMAAEITRLIDAAERALATEHRWSVPMTVIRRKLASNQGCRTEVAQNRKTTWIARYVICT